MKAKYETMENKANPTADEKETTELVKEFFKKGGYEFMTQLETDYKCASMCSVPLFYLTLDISKGKPEQECTKAIIEEVTGKTLVAVICILTGVILLCAMVCSFPLCTGFENAHAKDEKE